MFTFTPQHVHTRLARGDSISLLRAMGRENEEQWGFGKNCVLIEQPFISLRAYLRVVGSARWKHAFPPTSYHYERWVRSHGKQSALDWATDWQLSHYSLYRCWRLRHCLPGQAPVLTRACCSCKSTLYASKHA